MPIFRNNRDEYEKSTYFEGLDIGIAHVFSANTLPMIDCIYSAGANVGMIKENGNVYDDRVIELLEKAGVEWQSPNRQFDFTIDCIGFFTNHPPAIGSVEVTRSGIHKYIETQVVDDIILMDVDNTTSKLIETFIGNPRAVLRTLEEFKGEIDELISHGIISVIGFGKIGRGLASIFKDYAEIIVVDIDDKALQLAQNLGFNAIHADQYSKDELSSEVGQSDIIFTATGHKGVVTKYFDKSKLENSLKINVGAVDEFGDDYTSDEVYLSKDKPFNFNLQPPTGSKYIDPILFAHLEGLKYIVLNQDKLERGYHKLPEAIDNQIVELFNEYNNSEADIFRKYFPDR